LHFRPGALPADWLGTAAAPLVVDVRRRVAFDDHERMLVSAVRREPGEVGQWCRQLRADRPVVVYCVHGHEVSQQTAVALRGVGIDARYLEDGIAGWAELGLPSRKKIAVGEHGWVTRERPKIDRVACPWLIRRFIDPEAVFLYVPTERVFDTAKITGATAYDIPGAEPFSHEGELCSFDMFLRLYEIRDPVLDDLAVIVRGADTARPELAPQAPGLLALSLGLSANFQDDHKMLEHGLTMYDAFYAWCRSCQGEKHNWRPKAA
jgi:rhodanese-related sulfurtransferase